MRPLTLAVPGLLALSLLTVVAEPAQAVGLCADESGHNGNRDLYNNMGPHPEADCEGVFCMGYSGGSWGTCVPLDVQCAEALPQVLPCNPPVHVAPCEVNGVALCQTTASAALALCLYGNLYNNQAGQPSSSCDGVVCTGFAHGDWQRCVLDCTADGCPRFWDDPCERLMCQPPMDP
jgi:hypothetical protein